jgi:hypothetical protein
MISRRTTSRGRFAVALAIAAAAIAALPSVAAAEAPPGQYVIGLELQAVDRQARTVSAVQHCTSPDLAGRVATFAVAPHIDMGPMEPGHVLGARVDGSTDPDTVVELGPPPCHFRPGGPGGPPGPGGSFGPGPGGPGPGGCPPPPGGEPGARPANAEQAPACGGPPDFVRGFLSRVWKFVGEADGYEDGRLSITVSRILNLPRRFRTQDDELVDEDALVLVGRARVYGSDGRRVAKSELDGAENVRVHGKILPTNRWQEDEDGQPVTTIRAKKVYILG